MTSTSSPELKIEPLGGDHDRAGFSCGVESLDRYLKIQASQDQRRKANGVFVVIDPHQPNSILGYYTLCATALPQGEVPVVVRKHIPRYPLVSATMLGRLAIAGEQQNAGLGALLLADAVRRAYASAGSVGSSMLIVDAIDEQAAGFYEAHGFIRLPESLRLVLPMQTIGKLYLSAS
ncbi:GNAT family N-acetyltransferase [Propionivibrio sp.]|uniref:GNAT family N-acetyltransferase n=1 Tax=Propionivibrio sp. TaxID=2212460 RepID=UPI003BF22EAD